MAAHSTTFRDWFVSSSCPEVAASSPMVVRPQAEVVGNIDNPELSCVGQTLLAPQFIRECMLTRGDGVVRASIYVSVIKVDSVTPAMKEANPDQFRDSGKIRDTGNDEIIYQRPRVVVTTLYDDPSYYAAFGRPRQQVRVLANREVTYSYTAIEPDDNYQRALGCRIDTSELTPDWIVRIEQMIEGLHQLTADVFEDADTSIVDSLYAAVSADQSDYCKYLTDLRTVFARVAGAGNLQYLLGDVYCLLCGDDIIARLDWLISVANMAALATGIAPTRDRVRALSMEMWPAHYSFAAFAYALDHDTAGILTVTVNNDGAVRAAMGMLEYDAFSIDPSRFGTYLLEARISVPAGGVPPKLDWVNCSVIEGYDPEIAGIIDRAIKSQTSADQDSDDLPFGTISAERDLERLIDIEVEAGVSGASADCRRGLKLVKADGCSAAHFRNYSSEPLPFDDADAGAYRVSAAAVCDSTLLFNNCGKDSLFMKLVKYGRAHHIELVDCGGRRVLVVYCTFGVARIDYDHLLNVACWGRQMVKCGRLIGYDADSDKYNGQSYKDNISYGEAMRIHATSERHKTDHDLTCLGIPLYLIENSALGSASVWDYLRARLPVVENVWPTGPGRIFASVRCADALGVAARRFFVGAADIVPIGINTSTGAATGTSTILHKTESGLIDVAAAESIDASHLDRYLRNMAFVNMEPDELEGAVGDIHIAGAEISCYAPRGAPRIATLIHNMLVDRCGRIYWLPRLAETQIKSTLWTPDTHTRIISTATPHRRATIEVLYELALRGEFAPLSITHALRLIGQL